MAVFDDTIPDHTLAFYDHHVDLSRERPVPHKGATTYESLPFTRPESKLRYCET
jgi:hypothetical protein